MTILKLAVLGASLQTTSLTFLFVLIEAYRAMGQLANHTLALLLVSLNITALGTNLRTPRPPIWPSSRPRERIAPKYLKQPFLKSCHFETIHSI